MALVALKASYYKSSLCNEVGQEQAKKSEQEVRIIHVLCLLTLNNKKKQKKVSANS